MKTAESASSQALEQDIQPVQTLSPEQTALFREMIAAGVAVGRKKSKANPKMDEYVFTYARSVAVIDVEQTAALIDKAAAFMKGLMDEKRPILVLGSQPTARDFVRSFADKYGLLFITTRWLGGTFTNFKTISQRIEHFKKLKADKASGALDKYTKKERVGFDRLIKNLDSSFSGVEEMTSLPAALFVVDPGAHDIAVREARRMKVPIIAIMSNDADPRGIAYPIPANDNARASLSWIFARLESRLS